jgi:hypothetical protein
MGLGRVENGNWTTLMLFSVDYIAIAIKYCNIGSKPQAQQFVVPYYGDPYLQLESPKQTQKLVCYLIEK